MRIIPAIDIIEGKCVRLTEGNYSTKKVYNEDPVEVAKEFEDQGLKYLHLVDLDGAKASRIINYKVLEKISKSTSLIIDFGGGIKTDDDIKIAFNSGAYQITGGSIAVKNPSLFKFWIRQYGKDKIILGADCRNRNIAIEGWQESSDIDVIDFIEAYVTIGIKNVICTDISKDGKLAGPSLKLYAEILSQTKASLIASGGVTTMEDLRFLKEIGCEGAIIGKAIYEGRIKVKELSKLC
ncbi:MAG: 1-(5-phosphoribosyl)-5-[(5-phosphoribosylamino)methylideneamino]imidazole-4-carboxamide isomerase [Flavobacteriales bacterium]|nr:1-(5-phosphoribosyl)-5-[(5-phosphoribosylamino)methylideneamino]imidazole-4-carboxamide isomerase [Flavobacteriales bacterium]